MVVAIIGILAASGSTLMAYLVQNFVYLPNQMNTDMAASDAEKIMIEGDATARGLRFSRVLSSIADNQLAFVNQDGQSITLRLDTASGQLYRSVASGPESAIPYYASSGVTFSGKSNKLFTYYDSNEAVTATASSVRRVKLALIAKTGTGAYADWQGQSEIASAVAVPRYQ